jgi:hypothetical protein
MNAPDSPEKEANSEPNTALPVRKPRRLRIGEREITAMCECLARRMTERESCAVLQIEERTWYRWKSHARNSERLKKYLDRIVGAKIKTHIANIEDGAIGAGPHKRADWRASAHILSLTDPTRFQPSGGAQAPASPPPPINIERMNVWIEAAMHAVKDAGQVVVQEVKQIEDLSAPAEPPPPAAVSRATPLPAHWHPGRRKPVQVTVKSSPPSFEI